MDHLESVKRELSAHFGASITPDQISGIIQAVVMIISLFKPQAPQSSQASTPPKPRG